MTNVSMLRRLTIYLLMIGILALAMTIALMATEFHETTQVLRDRGLSALAQTVADSATRRPDGTVAIDLPPDAAATLAREEYTYTVNNIYGEVLAAQPPDLTGALHPFRPHTESHIEYFQHVGNGDEDYFGITVKADVGGQPVWVQVTEEIEDPESAVTGAVRLFLAKAAAILIPFFAISILITLWSIRRSLRPLNRISAQAAAITPANLNFRLDPDDAPIEIRPLVGAFNGVLARLEHALEAQKKFTADAAHELLTPLAVMKAHVDLMSDREQAADLADDIAKMTESVNQLLELSELEASTELLHDDVDLRAVADDVVKMMEPMCQQRGIELRLATPATPVEVKGCPRNLARAVRNLVENALRHATGATKVEVRVEAPGKVHVIDDGPGVPAAYRETAFERFSRPPQGTSSGSGLGLAIVRETVSRHGGTVTLHDAPGGGAQFTIELPASQDQATKS